MANLAYVPDVALNSSDLLISANGPVQSKTRDAFEDGVKVEGQNRQRNGSDLHFCNSLLSVEGFPAAEVTTLTPLSDIKAGTLFRAEGDVLATFKAEARAGRDRKGDDGVWKPGPPVADMAISIFVERLVPVGNVRDLLRSASSTQVSAASGSAAQRNGSSATTSVGASK